MEKCPTLSSDDIARLAGLVRSVLARDPSQIDTARAVAARMADDLACRGATPTQLMPLRAPLGPGDRPG